MKILILGQGGREHALVKTFKKSPQVEEIHVLPGNDGMKSEALCHDISLTDHQSILKLCQNENFTFVFIGPEDPLVAGMADYLRDSGVPVVGPSQEASRLEGSKIFAKEFMLEAQIPTARFFIVSSVEETIKSAKNFKPPYVLKADGLAAGKGVFICQNEAELKESAYNLFENKILGDSGRRALLEEFEGGYELSFLVLTNGKDFQTLPLAQDHKRLKDNQQGPNTGGMGTIAPMIISEKLRKDIEEKIVTPTVDLLTKKNFLYRGIIFIGLMITEKGPKVIEYNVRLGDPETQVIMPLIQQDLAVVMKELALGNLSPITIEPHLHSCCVILASPGYPEKTEKGVEIFGLEKIIPDSRHYLIHSGTKMSSDKWVTHGGRVLGCVGIGSSRSEAIKNAYKLVEQITWKGIQFRKDIGSPAPTHS